MTVVLAMRFTSIVPSSVIIHVSLLLGWRCLELTVPPLKVIVTIRCVAIGFRLSVTLANVHVATPLDVISSRSLSSPTMVVRNLPSQPVTTPVAITTAPLRMGCWSRSWCRCRLTPVQRKGTTVETTEATEVSIGFIKT